MSGQGFKKIATGYQPRPLQAHLHASMKRFNAIVCHRRFGKTVFSINHMIAAGLRNELPDPRYAYLAPLYSQAKRVAWDYLKKFTAPIPGVTVNEADLRVDIARPGRSDVIRFQLLGADNPVSLKGIYLDGVLLDEYGEMNPQAWGEVIRPTLSDRIGWATFVGTPKGRNHFHEIVERAMKSGNPEWFGAIYKASETGIIPQAELDSARAEMTEEEYMQEFECSFSAGITGAYYSRELELADKEKRIGIVPYDPSVPVSTYWDLGIGDTTAIWFIQQCGREIHAIDYVEASGVGLAHYAKQVKERRYVYSDHVLPHDGAARELGTGKTRQEQLQALGIRTRILPRAAIDDGIQAVRTLLPRVWFDAEKCKRGIECLQNYQRGWDAKHNIFKSSPLHNWASNGSDAFRYVAMGLREERYQDARRLPDRAESEWDVFSPL